MSPVSIDISGDSLNICLSNVLLFPSTVWISSRCAAKLVSLRDTDPQVYVAYSLTTIYQRRRSMYGFAIDQQTYFAHFEAHFTTSHETSLVR